MANYDEKHFHAVKKERQKFNLKFNGNRTVARRILFSEDLWILCSIEHLKKKQLLTDGYYLKLTAIPGLETKVDWDCLPHSIT